MPEWAKTFVSPKVNGCIQYHGLIFTPVDGYDDRTFVRICDWNAVNFFMNFSTKMPQDFYKTGPYFMTEERSNAPATEGRNPENSRGAIFRTSVEISSIVLSGNYGLVIKEETQVSSSSCCYGRWTASQPVLCSSEASFETGVRLECVRSCVSVRSPEFECSGPQLGDLSSKFSGLSLKVWGSRYCELEVSRVLKLRNGSNIREDEVRREQLWNPGEQLFVKMPSNINNTSRAWTEVQMQKAIKAFRETRSQRHAADLYGVPHSCLQRRQQSGEDRPLKIKVVKQRSIRNKKNSCRFCSVKYSDPRSEKLGDWIQCMGGGKECYHEHCVGAKRKKKFIYGKCRLNY
ncbi:hypothetical protein ANN_16254 [Periplaneta americana]|uniref:HTH psq-type domain-containing protein n=1 Tax=Periplaneta americana TaxID=6978 RepID=A0ABQ8SKE5_PERAM|nr:hypothetical protein ANN_16254 [Periplaneta americana]